MASLWRLYGYRRKNGDCYLQNPHMVRVHFLSYDGVSSHHLFCTCFLDEYKALYFVGAKKSIEVSLEKSWPLG